LSFLHKTIANGSTSAYKKFSASAKQASSTAKHAMDEVKQEAKQNAAETFSSFDGSATSLISGIQGTFGGLVAAMGPALLPVAALAAVGVGLIGKELENNAEKAQQAKERVSELTDELIESGVTGTRSLEGISDELRTMASESDDAKKSLKDIGDQARITGNNFKDLAPAFAGDPEALREAIRLTEQRIKTDEAYIADTEDWTNRYSDTFDRRIAKNKELLTELQGVDQQVKDAAKNEALWLESGGPELELKTTLIDSLGDAYTDAATETDAFIDAESGVFDVKAYLHSMHEREQAIKDYTSTLATVDLSPEAKQHLDSFGIEVGAAMLQGYVKSSPKTRQELNRLWTKAGQEGVDAATTVIADKLVNKTFQGPAIKPTMDTRAWDNGVKYIQKGFKVPVTFVTRNGRIIQ